MNPNEPKEVDECTHNYGTLGVGCMPWCSKTKSLLRPSTSNPTNQREAKKQFMLCNEPAKNDDYACNTCGGDIRGTDCCNPEKCTVYDEEGNPV